MWSLTEKGVVNSAPHNEQKGFLDEGFILTNLEILDSLISWNEKRPEKFVMKILILSNFKSNNLSVTVSGYGNVKYQTCVLKKYLHMIKLQLFLPVYG